jgi:hypothetical protein
MHMKTFILAGALVGSGLSSAISGPCTRKSRASQKRLRPKMPVQARRSARQVRQPRR